MYSLFYEDVQGPDGFLKSKRVRICIGNLSEMSERAGRREHGAPSARSGARGPDSPGAPGCGAW